MSTIPHICLYHPNHTHTHTVLLCAQWCGLALGRQWPPQGYVNMGCGYVYSASGITLESKTWGIFRIGEYPATSVSFSLWTIYYK